MILIEWSGLFEISKSYSLTSSFFIEESRWLSDFTAKQMRHSGNREIVLLPTQFILQFIFFHVRFSLFLPLLLLWDRQCFVSIGSDKRKTRISLICRWCASIYSFIQHSNSPDCVCVYVTSVFPLISNNCITYLRCWRNISVAISILDFYLKGKKKGEEKTITICRKVLLQEYV